MQATGEITLRREVRDGDAEAIVELHRRLYSAEYGMNDEFVSGVRTSLEICIEEGWPEGGGAWIVECDGEVVGSLGLTDDRDGLAKIRWVLLAPEARGHGLGRRMISEAVEEARRLGYERVHLHTFSELTTAASIYREQGFRVDSDETLVTWGPDITYQHYVLDL